MNPRFNFNPADHYIIETAIRLDDLEDTTKKVMNYCDKYQESEVYKNIISYLDTVDEETVTHTEKGWEDPGTLLKFCTLLKREITTQWFDWPGLAARMGSILLISIIFGLLYGRKLSGVYSGYRVGCESDVPVLSPDITDLNGAMLSLIGQSTFSNYGLALVSFPGMVVLWRYETATSIYPMWLGFWSVFIIEQPLLMMVTFFYSMVNYWWMGLYPGFWNYIFYWATHYLIAVNSTSIGTFCSSLIPDPGKCQSITGPILTFLFMFGGIFINLNDIPGWLTWAKYISMYYYGNEAIQENQWEHAIFGCEIGVNKGMGCEYEWYDTTFCNASNYLIEAKDIAENYGLSSDTKFRNFGLLICTALAFRSVAFGIMVYQFRR